MTNPTELHGDLDRFRQLMTAALDGELSGREQSEFQQLLAASPALQREWNEYRKLKDITMQIRFTDPPDEIWERYWHDVYNRLERRVAWILLSVGSIVLLAFFGWMTVNSVLADASLPWLVKAAILALLAGAVILFVSVLREKLLTRKSDKYRDIQR